MKFKEIFKKIKNKKYCLTALLLAGLLIFAVFGGLNGSKSGKNQAYAATEPAIKNLDLNGVRYTYQTSLKELKNSYNLFRYPFNENYFQITNDTEGVTSFKFLNGSSKTLTNEEITENVDIIKNSLSFSIQGNYMESLVVYDNTSGKTLPTSRYDIDNVSFTSQEIDKIRINFSNLNNVNGKSWNIVYQIVSFQYVPNNLSSIDIEYVRDNSIFKLYAFSNLPNEYIFDIDNIKGYSLRNIFSVFSVADEQNRENGIYTNVSNGGLGDNFSVDNSKYIALDNVKFLEDSILGTAIRCNYYYDYNNNANAPIFKGNILLSNEKFDSSFLQALATSNEPVEQLFDGGIRLGGKFNENKRINAIYYDFYLHDSGLDRGPRVNTLSTNNNSLFQNNILWNYSRLENININSITYYNQNQLMYVETVQNLKTEYNGTTYAALSGQVEDILYNVNYVGDIEEIEFNQKVEEDFTNLIKTAGLGGFLGLLLGLLFGVPGLGAGIGALIGLGVGIVPLIIDGLQSIFGKDFLSGLYNFFKSITEFFANFVDTIINFLMSIITNPFVLVFIVIAAIIFLFFYFKNK